MTNFFHKIVNHLWVFWSNIRWHKSARFYNEILPEDSNLKTIKAIQETVSRVYSKFKYTADKADQLWDCVTPPPQNYKHYVEDQIKDDCDGWAAVMHYVFYKNDIESYILSVEEKWDGHCVCLFKFKHKWYINDYNSIHEGFYDMNEAINNYNEIYAKEYKPKTPVCHNGLVKYDFEKGKFKLVNLKRIQK